MGGCQRLTAQPFSAAGAVPDETPTVPAGNAMLGPGQNIMTGKGNSVCAFGKSHPD
ncbi:hypothetical protein JCM15831A_05350 [Asaia astilbis]